MRRILWVVAVLTACGSVNAQGLRVPLTVTEPAGVVRVDEPVTSGVPLPKGAVTDVGRLRLVGPDGKPVPAQFRVLSRWWKGLEGPKGAAFANGDGSIKWVLVDFQANVPVKGSAGVTLTDGGAAPAATPLKVSQTAEAVAVVTGPLKFTVSKTAFHLFDSVWLDANGDGTFSDDEQVLKARPGDGFVIVGMDGKRYGSATHAVGPLKVTVEEAGPLRAVVTVEGVMRAGDNAGGYDLVGPSGSGTVHVPGRDGEKIGYTVRIHACAGKPYVRVFHTLRCLGKTTNSLNDRSVKQWPYCVASPRQPGNFFVKSGTLETSLRLAGPLTYTFGGDLLASERDRPPAGVEGAPATGVLRGKDAATLFQASSAGWIWQVAENRIYDPNLKANIAFMKSQGQNKPYFEYAPAYYDILTKREGRPFMGYRIEAGGTTVAGNRAAGWVDLADGHRGVAVMVRHLWQMYPKTLAVTGAGGLTVGLWPGECARGHLFEGQIHRTHEVLYHFHAGDAKSAKVGDVAAAFRGRLIARAPSAWYVNSGALGRCVVADRTKHPLYEAWAATAVHPGLDPKLNYSWDSSIAVEREKYDEYNWMNFGDSSKGGGLWYFGQFMEYDCCYALMLHFFRTGDRAFFDVADPTARFLMGIATHQGGYGHQFPEASHSWETGLLYYYYVTGSLEAREAMDWMADYRVKAATLSGYNHKPNCWRYNGRNAAWELWGLLALYDLTGDLTYLTLAEDGIQVLLKRLSPQGTFGTRSSFQLGSACDALGRYWERTGSKEGKRLLLAIINYFAGKNRSGDWHSPWLINGYAQAYRATGEKKYLDLAAGAYRQAFRRGKPDDLGWRPKFRTGTAAVKGWTRLTRSAQAYLHALEHEN